MPTKYRSIFSPSTAEERAANFERYWTFSQNHSGELFESRKELSVKRDKLQYFHANPVRSRKPLADPEAFYRNHIRFKDDPAEFDRKTLLLTCIYKFARHEWVGISGAWDAIPDFSKSKTVTEKISRYHLAEEFGHVRLFHEMFRTFHLDKVEWVPLGPWMQKVYRLFPKVPEKLMSSLAFVTELMGITFYQHTDALLDSVFADEPEARDRIRELLHEIMVDELAHIGQRRNFLGGIGIRCAQGMVSPLYKLFFKDLPETPYLFDVPAMIRDGLAFDYNGVSPDLLKRSWVPSYCQV